MYVCVMVAAVDSRSKFSSSLLPSPLLCSPRCCRFEV